MPLATAVDAERPYEVVPRKPCGYVRIRIDVLAIVPYDEIVINGLAVDPQSRQRKRNNNEPVGNTIWQRHHK